MSIKCVAGKEPSVLSTLEEAGLKPVIPMSGGKCSLPGYVFVDCHPDDPALNSALASMQLKLVTTGAGEPFVMDEQTVEKFLKTVSGQGEVSLDTRVLVEEGLFKGYEGLVVEQREDKLVVCIELNSGGGTVNVKVLRSQVRVI